ncbi:MAG: DUF2752 domain-containing protein [Planctomycetaceae bacterium]|nr:DUF2752 domain-containing protein [Planctomycetaceae bacterium]
MNEPERIETPVGRNRPNRQVRLFLFLASVATASLFVAAGRLEPDSRGYGTHEQLGLPPCWVLKSTGIRCPHCGMTTSICHLVRGNLRQSWHCHPSGPLLSVLLTMSCLWCLKVSVTGDWWLTDDPMMWFIRIVLSYVAFTAAVWMLTVIG